MKRLVLLLTVVALCGCAAQKRTAQPAVIEFKKIWDSAPHSAFTDLIRFKNQFYCAFREAPGHVSGPNGTIRIISSTDGDNWRTVTEFRLADVDLRDPKLSITPDKRLMVLIDGERYKDGKVATRKPFVSFSDAAGAVFSKPEQSALDPKIEVRSDWVWRLTWHNNTGYAMDYQPGALHLLKTTDGRSFQHVSELKIDGGPNESTIRFDKNGKMYVVIRRDGADKVGAIATSNEPYTNWTFSKIGERIGGPEFFFLNDSTLCIASRLYIKNPPGAEKEYKGYKTALFFTDLSGKIKKTIPFEQSGGDNSYPGLVSYKNKLWVSYYSSHEGKTSIYLAKVPMQMLE